MRNSHVWVFFPHPHQPLSPIAFAFPIPSPPWIFPSFIPPPCPPQHPSVPCQPGATLGLPTPPSSVLSQMYLWVHTHNTCAHTHVCTHTCARTHREKTESSYTYYLINLILTGVISLGHTGYYIILVTLRCWDVNAPESRVSRKDEPSAASPRQLLVPQPHPSWCCSLSMQGFHVSVMISTPQFSPVDPQLWHVTSEYLVVSLSSWLSQSPLCERKWKGTAQFGGVAVYPLNIPLRLECGRVWANLEDMW